VAFELLIPGDFYNSDVIDRERDIGYRKVCGPDREGFEGGLLNLGSKWIPLTYDIDRTPDSTYSQINFDNFGSGISIHIQVDSIRHGFASQFQSRFEFQDAAEKHAAKLIAAEAMLYQ
jgi:hypothetical protein